MWASFVNGPLPQFVANCKIYIIKAGILHLTYLVCYGTFSLSIFEESPMELLLYHEGRWKCSYHVFCSCNMSGVVLQLSRGTQTRSSVRPMASSSESLSSLPSKRRRYAKRSRARQRRKQKPTKTPRQFCTLSSSCYSPSFVERI